MLKVYLIAHTPMPEKVVSAAAKMCYSDAGADALLDGMTDEAADRFLHMLSELGHESPIEHASFTFAIEGVSRSLLAQITRHQNEVKFISASLQYSNYAGQADFVVPYEILTASQWVHDFYLKKCRAAMEHYADIGACGISRDAAGYLAPQSLRNVLIISATPYQWKHMIGQRTCRRNTDETRFVLLKIWADLYALDPELFSPELAGPFCQREGCLEKDMSCGCPCEKGALPLALLRQDYPAALEGGGQ